MKHDEKLVEALARAFCLRRVQSHLTADDYPCAQCIAHAQQFVGEHCLIQLPEEAPDD